MKRVPLNQKKPEAPAPRRNGTHVDVDLDAEENEALSRSSLRNHRSKRGQAAWYIRQGLKTDGLLTAG
jgi:hypothetical protein